MASSHLAERPNPKLLSKGEDKSSLKYIINVLLSDSEYFIEKKFDLSTRVWVSVFDAPKLFSRGQTLGAKSAKKCYHVGTLETFHLWSLTLVWRPKGRPLSSSPITLLDSFTSQIDRPSVKTPLGLRRSWRQATVKKWMSNTSRGRQFWYKRLIMVTNITFSVFSRSPKIEMGCRQYVSNICASKSVHQGCALTGIITRKCTVLFWNRMVHVYNLKQWISLTMFHFL